MKEAGASRISDRPTELSEATEELKFMKSKKLKIAVAVTSGIVLCGAIVFGLIFFNGISGIRINPVYHDGQIKVALVGDSVTYGHSIKNWPKNNYPALLSDMLGENYCVKSYGVSGSTVQPDGDQPYNITKAYTWSHDYQADIIVLMLGSNDSKPENWKSTDKFKTEYLKLIDSYMSEKNPPELILCTPPTAYFPEGVTEGLSNYDVQPFIIEEVAEIVRNVAEEKGFKLIDMNTLTENRRDLFGKDNVHPNNDGAKLIAETVYDFIINL